MAKEIFLQPYVADAHAIMQRMWIVNRGLIRSNVTKLREITLRMTEDRARNPELVRGPRNPHRAADYWRGNGACPDR